MKKSWVLLAAFSIIVAVGANLSIAMAQNSPEKVTIAQFGQERFLLYLPLYVAME